MLDPGQTTFQGINSSRFLSLQEAAEILGMSEVFVRRHRFEIGAHKFGRVWKIHAGNLRRWIDEHFQGRPALALAKEDPGHKAVQPGHLPDEKRRRGSRDCGSRGISKNGEISLPPEESPELHPSNLIPSASGQKSERPFKSVASFLEERIRWIGIHRSRRHAKDTEGILKNLTRIRPEWGILPPEAITIEMAEEFQEALSERLASAKKTNYTANKVVNHLMTCWNYPWGKRRGKKVYENPFACLDMLRYSKKVIRVPLPSQIDLILEKMNEAEGRLYLQIMARTGARPGEARETRWEDVLFDEGSIILWTSKKRDGIRTPRRIILEDDLLADLKFWRELNDQAIYLFQQEGKVEPRTHSWAKKVQARACKLAKLEYFHPHVYRHYFTRKLLNDRVPLTELQGILGHEDFTTTAKYIGQLKGIGYVEGKEEEKE